MRMGKRVYPLVLAALLALSACGQGDAAGPDSSPPGSTQSTAAASPEASETGEAPVEIRFFRVAVTQDPTKDRVLLELQKRTNTKLEFVTAPWDQQGTKVNTMLASGEVIDVISMDYDQVNYNGHARNGTILQLDEYLKDTDRYLIESTIAYDDVFKKFLVDGNVYGIPCINQPGGGWVAGIRKDWLDKVGLELPKTPEDLYLVFKAFKEQDPDGNGVDDTIGMTTAQIFDSWRVFMDAYSPPVNFLTGDGGDLIYRDVSEQRKKSLALVKRLYDEDIINKDMFTIRDRDLCLNDFTAGRCGIGFSPMWAKSLSEVKANFPEAEIELLYPTPHDPAYTNGATTNASDWSWLINVLPKSCRNPERVLDLLEYMNTEEGRKLMCTGIEGIHYQSYADGVFTGISQAEQDADWDVKDGEGPTGHPLWWGLVSTINGPVDFETYRGNLAEGLRNCGTFVSAEDKENNPFYEQRKLITTIPGEDACPARLDSLSQYGGKLKSIREEYEARLVLEPAANFDAIWEEYVEQMNANGLGEIMTEAEAWKAENQ